jgi:hypothetical protein
VNFNKIELAKLIELTLQRRKFQELPIFFVKNWRNFARKKTLLARALENFCKVRHRLGPPKENQLGHSQPLNRLTFSACDRKKEGDWSFLSSNREEGFLNLTRGGWLGFFSSARQEGFCMP